MTPAEKRQAVVNAAVNAVGLGAIGNVREAYLDLIAKGETRPRREEMARMSGCGLVVAGIWREAGVVAPELEPPYKTGAAMSRLMEVAERAQAFRSLSAMLMQPGDMVLIGKNAPARPSSNDAVVLATWEQACAQVLATWGGGEHVFTVVAVDMQGGTVTSVDGGQLLPGGGPFAVRSVTRHFALRGKDHQLWLGGRRMVAAVDVSRFPFVGDDDGVEVDLDNA